MNYFDETDATETKWSNWTMKPAKRAMPWTNYVSALVLAIASVVVIGGPIS